MTIDFCWSMPWPTVQITYHSDLSAVKGVVCVYITGWVSVVYMYICTLVGMVRGREERRGGQKKWKWHWDRRYRWNDLVRTLLYLTHILSSLLCPCSSKEGAPVLLCLSPLPSPGGQWAWPGLLSRWKTVGATGCLPGLQRHRRPRVQWPHWRGGMSNDAGAVEGGAEREKCPPHTIDGAEGTGSWVALSTHLWISCSHNSSLSSTLTAASSYSQLSCPTWCWSPIWGQSCQLPMAANPITPQCRPQQILSWPAPSPH